MPDLRPFILGLALLGGCTAAPQVMWWRDDYSPEMFAADSALCRNYASAQLESPAAVGIDADRREELSRRLYDYCLSNLGYYQVEFGRGRRSPPPAPPLYDTRYRDIKYERPAGAPGANRV